MCLAWLDYGYALLGGVGLALLLITFAALTIWKAWPAINKLPGMSKFISWLFRPPLPRSSGEKLTVAIAELENDTPARDCERLIFDELNQIKDVIPIRLARIVATDTAGISKAEKLKHKTGADILLYGSVLRAGAGTAVRLHWIVGDKLRPNNPNEKYVLDSTKVALPSLFVIDLRRVLGLLVQTQLCQTIESLRGQPSIERLEPRIADVRTLIRDSSASWDTITLAGVQCALATALYTSSQQSGNNPQLTESISLYRQALDTYCQGDDFEASANTRNGLANALKLLGDHGTGTELFREAVDIYSAGLEDSKKVGGMVSVKFHINLGAALHAWGLREQGSQRLLEAESAYEAALRVWTKQASPFEWAMVQNNLGALMLDVGKRETGNVCLNKAVDFLTASLDVLTRKRTPLMWGVTQANVAVALLELGKRDPDIKFLRRCTDKCHEAHQELTRERVPLKWAGVQNTLGCALQAWGENESDQKHLEEAVQAYRLANEEQSEDLTPSAWAATQTNLGNALRELAERESGVRLLQDSIAAYRDALRQFTREKNPQDWASTMINLGNTLKILGERDADGPWLAEAEYAYLSGQEVFTQQFSQQKWAMIQGNLGTVEQSRSRSEARPDRLFNASNLYRSVLEVVSIETNAMLWAQTQVNLAGCLLEIGNRLRQVDIFREAAERYRASLIVYTTERAARENEIVSKQLQLIERYLARH